MDEVIYSASGPPPCMASMDEVIHSAPWRPWMKSSIVPAPLPPVWRLWMKSPAIVPAALSYLSFPVMRWAFEVGEGGFLSQFLMGSVVAFDFETPFARLVGQTP